MVIILSIPTSAIAQISPDFKMTDTDSVEWHLYDLLNNGNTVVLDFFFADCTPCKKLTPLMVDLYSEYGGDTGKVVVLGISDRDDDNKVRGFEQEFKVNYPSCGIEGGGDTITSLFSSWFSFFGWPTYAVICPNRNIFWNVDQSDSLNNVRLVIDSCNNTVSVMEQSKGEVPSIFPNPGTEFINVNLENKAIDKIEVFSLRGKRLVSKEFSKYKTSYKVETLGWESGIYFIRIHSRRELYNLKFSINTR